MKPIIVFDVNETLLDMSSLDPTFAELFAQGSGTELRQKWFKQVLELALTTTITGKYRNFDKLADAALRMLGAQRREEVTAGDRAKLTAALGSPRAYPDAQPGLRQLKEAGYRVVALTNSTKKAATSHLEHAGLRELFDDVLSADAVKCYKPAREVYEYAARELDVDTDEMIMVAAHSWDLAGALAAGCGAAFVERPEKALDPGGEEPQFRVKDIREAAKQIIAKHGQ